MGNPRHNPDVAAALVDRALNNHGVVLPLANYIKNVQASNSHSPPKQVPWDSTVSLPLTQDRVSPLTWVSFFLNHNPSAQPLTSFSTDGFLRPRRKAPEPAGPPKPSVPATGASALNRFTTGASGRTVFVVPPHAPRVPPPGSLRGLCTCV